MRNAKTEQAKTNLRQLPPLPRTRTPPASCGSTTSTRGYRFFVTENRGKVPPPPADTPGRITSDLVSWSVLPRRPTGTRLGNGRRGSGSEEGSQRHVSWAHHPGPRRTAGCRWRRSWRGVLFSREMGKGKRTKRRRRGGVVLFCFCFCFFCFVFFFCPRPWVAAWNESRETKTTWAHARGTWRRPICEQ